MKTIRIILLVSWVGVICFACEKSNDRKIIYTDTNIQIHSVDHFEYFQNPFKLCTIPIPIDSSIKYKIDIDLDGNDDFEFSAGHGDYGNSHEHCYVYYFGISVYPISSSSSVAQSPKYFNLDDKINDQITWTNNSITLHYSTTTGFPPTDDFTSCFVGVKVSDKFGYIKLSKLVYNGIAIEEYAIHKKANEEIKCGEQ